MKTVQAVEELAVSQHYMKQYTVEQDGSVTQMLRAHSLRESEVIEGAKESQSIHSFQTEFAVFAKDIKEVRSLVNLWKDEFVRRKTIQGLPPLEKAVMSDNSREGGFSQSILA